MYGLCIKINLGLYSCLSPIYTIYLWACDSRSGCENGENDVEGYGDGDGIWFGSEDDRSCYCAW